MRLAYMRFAAAIFTNLTRDHLDFHGDMQQYFAAKRRLFEMLPAGAPSLINVDDPWGQELARNLPHVLTYGINNQADVRAVAIQSRVWAMDLSMRSAPLRATCSGAGGPYIVG